MRSERGALVLSAVAAALLAAVGDRGRARHRLGRHPARRPVQPLLRGHRALHPAGGARSSRGPTTSDYPFGYLFFEPLINTVKGLLILGVSAFALVDAGIALASGGREVEFGPAALYAAFATVACLAVVWALRRGRAASPLVAADVETWTVNAAVSGGVLAGFLLAIWLQRAGHAGAALTSTRRWSPSSSCSPGRCRCAWRAAASSRSSTARPRGGGRRHGGRGRPRPRRPARSRAIWVRAIQPGRHRLRRRPRPGAARRPRSTSPPPTGCAGRSSPPSPAATRRCVVDVVFTAVEAYAAPTAGLTRSRPPDP